MSFLVKSKLKGTEGIAPNGAAVGLPFAVQSGALMSFFSVRKSYRIQLVPSH
jgi:hypothetical protein